MDGNLRCCNAVDQPVRDFPLFRLCHAHDAGDTIHGAGRCADEPPRIPGLGCLGYDSDRDSDMDLPPARRALWATRRAVVLSGTTCWALLFLLFWIAMLNMNLARLETALIALPLAWVEMIVAALIAQWSARRSA